MKKSLFLVTAIALLTLCSCGPRDGEYTFHIYTTNDVHGHYFDSLYVEGAPTQGSLLAVSHYIDSLRMLHGRNNVILIDAGDFLQGDNAAYYYNYVDTVSRHLYARMAEYIGYDVVTVGNHDIEAGHAVYDRMKKQLSMPFLAGNAVCTDSDKNVIRNADGSYRTYFDNCKVIKRHGIKIAVLGYTNASIKSWLSEDVWHGMTFESLIPLVQEDIDRISARVHPDVVIVSTHSGTGKGDGSLLESQGLDLMKSLHGVDFLLCAHDHRPYIAESENICLINSGSHCRNLGHGEIHLVVKDGKVVAKSLHADLLPVNKSLTDEAMRAKFAADYEAVKAFTLTPVGTIYADIRTRDAYTGMCNYTNLLHSISLWETSADMSFAAPLTFNGFLRAGTLLYNDLFAIYPFENQLFVVNMTGREIRNYMEYSCDTWINTVSGKRSGEHILKISNAGDSRTGQRRWSFVNMYYNFDSAGGLNYTVDVTKPYGRRVKIASFADGRPFDENAIYSVAMTSYRANGGGGFMSAAGISDTEMRIVEKYPEIRNIIYEYLKEFGNFNFEFLGEPTVVGRWSFVPASVAEPLLKKDMALLFGN